MRSEGGSKERNKRNNPKNYKNDRGKGNNEGRVEITSRMDENEGKNMEGGERVGKISRVEENKEKKGK